MQLYLIRHAQSANNSKPESQRIEDPEITELGHEQSRALAQWMAQLPIDVLVTSGFRRTLQTTNYLADALQTPINIWRDLHEVGGCYRGYVPGQERGAPGLSRQAILDLYPTSIIDTSIGPDGWWACQPYETQAAAMTRSQKMIDQFVTQFGSTNKTIAAVIHADFKVCLLKQILGDAFTAQTIGPMLNTGVTKLNYNENRWRLDVLNGITHLPVEWIS